MQGKGPNENPCSIFAGHWICQYYDSNSNVTNLYDPSYGGDVIWAKGEAQPGNGGRGDAAYPTQKALGDQ